MSNKELIEKNKQRLAEERTRLEKLLSKVAVKDEKNGDFHPKYPDMGSGEEENALEVEQFQTNIAEEHDLEERLRSIDLALEKISDGSYGMCLVGGEEIPQERLEAVPEAVTCVEHG